MFTTFCNVACLTMSAINLLKRKKVIVQQSVYLSLHAVSWRFGEDDLNGANNFEILEEWSVKHSFNDIGLASQE